MFPHQLPREAVDELRLSWSLITTHGEEAMKYFSLFSGVGGFEMPLNELGFDCVGQSEIDKYASSVLRYRFPNVPNYGDITKINWSAVPDFGLLVGGSPCQDLSVAGKRAGLDGERSGLFGQYVRALNEKQPEYFIWENVKGALSSNDGRDFAAILAAFSEAGYSLWWQVLNAKDFGVPQNRERVFVVGTRSDIGSPREVFFERGDEQQNSGQILHENKSGTVSLHSESVALRAGASANYQTIMRTPLRFLKRNQKNIEGDYAFTVDAGQTAGVTDGMRVRRLMPIEAERLMSWPDGHTQYGDFDGVVKEMSDSQRYKMCGNGVVSAVVAEVVKAHLL